MKLTKNNNGYMQIRLYDKNLKSKTFRVHQLVAYMFINNENNKKNLLIIMIEIFVIIITKI